jgi:hypothetical protein
MRTRMMKVIFFWVLKNDVRETGDDVDGIFSNSCVHEGNAPWVVETELPHLAVAYAGV